MLAVFHGSTDVCSAISYENGFRQVDAEIGQNGDHYLLYVCTCVAQIRIKLLSCNNSVHELPFVCDIMDRYSDVSHLPV